MDREFRLHRDNLPAAKQLRKRLTPSEVVLWDHLRDRRFYGLKFRRQHPVGAFVLDFFCQEMMFAIEIDGGIHLDPEQAKRDRDRQLTLEEHHIQFFRWTAEDVERDCDQLLCQLASTLGLDTSSD
ncbi:MAG: endonuclease domain-containing protein [Dehalococcoidia bacterium]